MSGRVIVAVGAILLVAVCGLLSTFAQGEMTDKVNAKLPKEDQFDPFGWYWSKVRRLHREYTRLYPAGRLFWRQKLLMGVMLLGMLIVVLSLQFEGK